MSPPRRQGLRPVIREIPPSDLTIYRVHEHQLDQSARGSPVDLLLNFSLFFLGVAATTGGTLYSLPPPVPPAGDRPFYIFLIFFLVSLSLGVVLLSVWLKMRTSARSIIRDIKSQRPSNPEAIQEDGGEVATEG